MFCACQHVNNTLANEEKVGDLRVCEDCNHFAIISQHPTKQFRIFAHNVIFQRVFVGIILAILPICIMKKNQIWKFCVKGIISVNGTHVNVYQIS